MDDAGSPLLDFDPALLLQDPDLLFSDGELSDWCGAGG
jgi:hypothetical protein